MIRYNSPSQLKLGFYEAPFKNELDLNNRWVVLSQRLPWDDMASIYYRKMSSGQGRPSKDARIVIGAVILKHKLKLSDQETIEQIRENPYLQFFVGMEKFTNEAAFAPTLFVEIRKRLGLEEFDAMTHSILVKAGMVEQKKSTEEKAGENNEESKNKGELLIDATVSPQMIKYPNDLELLSDARVCSEGLIDILYVPEEGKVKPRTYRKNARLKFLSVAKKRKKNYKVIRKAIGVQLRYLRRNIQTINLMLDQDADSLKTLNRQWYKKLLVIQHVYAQQYSMYETRTHICPNRIVNIHQPHVRPIITGKASVKAEFGSKMTLYMLDGYARIGNFSWDAFNEGAHLPQDIENFRKMYGHYPEKILADKIYGNRENRRLLGELDILFSGKPLGRPKADQREAQKKLFEEDKGKRNQIEGKFGQGKNGYNLGKIRARLPETSQSWIASIVFVMNIVKFCKDFTMSFLNSVILNSRYHISSIEILSQSVTYRRVIQTLELFRLGFRSLFHPRPVLKFSPTF